MTLVTIQISRRIRAIVPITWKKNYFSEVEEVDYNLIEKSPKLDAQYVIDEMFESNKMIKIRGWIYNRNVNTRKVKPKLLLISEDKKYVIE